MYKTKSIYIIYKATSKTSGKSYIGVTSNFKQRKIRHKSAAYNVKNDKSSNTYFARAIRKYGFEDFTWDILFKTPNKQSAFEIYEKYFIAVYNTFLGEGYNLTEGGEGNNLNKGIKLSQTTKDKISKSMTGIKKSKEHSKNISKAKRGKTNPKGALAHSKTWTIIFPDGHKETIRNLNKFCRKHKLSAGHMHAVANGKRNHHKQFRCSYVV